MPFSFTRLFPASTDFLHIDAHTARPRASRPGNSVVPSPRPEVQEFEPLGDSEASDRESLRSSRHARAMRRKSPFSFPKVALFGFSGRVLFLRIAVGDGRDIVV